MMAASQSDGSERYRDLMAFERHGERSARPHVLHGDTRATVRWFNPSKGYGLATVPALGADAFLPGAVVQPLGYLDLPAGTEIAVDVIDSSKGPAVGRIYQILSMPEGARPAAVMTRPAPSFDRGRRGGGGGFSGPHPEAGPPVEGTVKFYSAEKGFGFIATDDGGGKDAFVHASALQRAGIDGLQPEQRVRVTLRMGQKGQQVDSIELI
jgi:CspA family cold shock protein